MHKLLTIHAHPALQTHIASGRHKFSSVLQQIFEDIGFAVRLGDQNTANFLKDAFDRSYHIFYIDGTQGPRALNMRKSYYKPFWTLEKPNTRHRGRIAHKAFNPQIVGPALARPFFEKMQEKHIGADSPMGGIEGHVLVPLQGKLCKKRPWQFADLATMLRTIRTHDPDRRIVLKPHPQEEYSAGERALVKQLAHMPNVTVVDAPIHSLLSRCAYVATQNSAVAFEGILYRKPAILFAQSHYHHLFPVVKKPEDAAEAFDRVRTESFLFEKYLYWFLQMNSINVLHATGRAKMIEVLYESGWDLPFQP